MYRTYAIIFGIAYLLSACQTPPPEPPPTHCVLQLEVLSAEYLEALHEACPHTALDDCPEARWVEQEYDARWQEAMQCH